MGKTTNSKQNTLAHSHYPKMNSKMNKTTQNLAILKEIIDT